MTSQNFEYQCPVCSHALSPLRGRTSEFFCRLCGTAVVLTEPERCLYLEPGAVGHSRAALLPRPGAEPDPPTFS